VDDKAKTYTQLRDRIMKYIS